MESYRQMSTPRIRSPIDQLKVFSPHHLTDLLFLLHLFAHKGRRCCTPLGGSTVHSSTCETSPPAHIWETQGKYSMACLPNVFDDLVLVYVCVCILYIYTQFFHILFIFTIVCLHSLFHVNALVSLIILFPSLYCGTSACSTALSRGDQCRSIGPKSAALQEWLQWNV